MQRYVKVAYISLCMHITSFLFLLFFLHQFSFLPRLLFHDIGETSKHSSIDHSYRSILLSYYLNWRIG